ncbi:hypothetical protein niasHS_014877 [Heterodera schachtii]|uniref:Uncharacterized protein n=1 Tax=Heterodera schachtii TaxID=97005 RepID=A0ABD2IP99_HETSC
MLFLCCFFGFPLASKDGLLKEEIAQHEDKKIAAMLLDVFLNGWRECIDWKRGEPSIRCVPFPEKKPEKCAKNMWENAMENVGNGKIKKC